MTQISNRFIDREIYREIFDTLFETIASLSTKTEASEFFSEFLSPNEKLMFAKRLAVGLLIAEGIDYREIREILKISTYTISIYSSRYKYGDSYRKVIDKIRTNKRIKQMILEIAEGLGSIGKVGGKGSGAWRALGEEAKKGKSKLLR